ncbi:MAG: hypothetical protein IKD83_05170 [Firmicutes bacterium]|nr:hypothetical protein [Bacillota bacterium]
MLDEYHRGKSIKAMASYHKRSDKAIILRLEKLGVLKGTEHIGIRRVKNNAKKKSLKRYATIGKDVKFNTEMWTEHEDSKLKEEFYLGLTFGEISDAHKRTMGEVVSRMVDLGLIK